MPRVVYSPGVEQDLYRLPRTVFDSFQRAFDALEIDPVAPGPRYRIKRLRGVSGDLVVRFDNWGAIYRVEGDQIRVLKVGPRSTLYRGR
ncbi:MAG: type II toxin-antitoxin system RelE family toxin [Thermoplasmata archaeon]